MKSHTSNEADMTSFGDMRMGYCILHSIFMLATEMLAFPHYGICFACFWGYLFYELRVMCRYIQWVGSMGDRCR